MWSVAGRAAPDTFGARSTTQRFRGAPDPVTNSRCAVITVSAAVLAACAAVAFSFGWRGHVVDRSGRTEIETMITVAALLAAGLLLIQFRRHRQLYLLLMLSALTAVGLMDFVLSALPRLVQGRGVPLGIHASLAAQAMVPLMFAVAGFVGEQMTTGRLLRRVLAISGACLGIVAVAVQIARRANPGTAGSALTLWVEVAASAVFVLAGVVFVRRSSRIGGTALLIGAACFLLAAGRLQTITIPIVATDWVTPRELLRLAAYGLLFAAACRGYARIRRADQQAAMSSQRERIARDLHDGLAQDLAAIAIQGHRLEAEFGADHPLTRAACRALATSREAIIDLSASRASDEELDTAPLKPVSPSRLKREFRRARTDDRCGPPDARGVVPKAVRPAPSNGTVRAPSPADLRRDRP